jgi:hypothetical protein
MMFWKKQEKWHEVRWSHGRRRIYLALQFARNGEPVSPSVEHLPPPQDAPAQEGQESDARETDARAADARGADAKAHAQVNGNGKLADGLIVAEVKAAVDDYNRKNLLALRVSAIRYRAEHVSDHGDLRAAARKLLNLLWKVDE